MENRFKHLLIDNRHLLPQPWSNYDVLKTGQFECISLWSENREKLIVQVGQQDDVWVGSMDYYVEGHGCSAYPGRKWGEFASREDAILYTMGEIEAHLIADKCRPALVNMIKHEIREFRFECAQLTLF